jgi:hypothetical protein
MLATLFSSTSCARGASTTPMGLQTHQSISSSFKKTIPVVENVIEKDRTPKHETSVGERPTLLWTSAKAIFHLIIWLQKNLKMIKAFSNLPNAS